MAYNYLKNISDSDLKILYKQADEYQSDKKYKDKLNIPTEEEYPELRKYVLEDYVLENDEKFSSSLAKAYLIFNIMGEIVIDLLKENNAPSLLYVKYDFEEQIDYFIDSPKKVKQSISTFGGDKRSIEYLLTISTAKELAVVQNNEKRRKLPSF